MAPGVVVDILAAGEETELDSHAWAPHASLENNGVSEMNRTNGQGAHSAAPSQLPDRLPETGIDVLIIGAGMGGLMAALECWRKGNNIVGILERNDGPVYSGAFS